MGDDGLCQGSVGVVPVLENFQMDNAFSRFPGPRTGDYPDDEYQQMLFTPRQNTNYPYPSGQGWEVLDVYFTVSDYLIDQAEPTFGLALIPEDEFDPCNFRRFYATNAGFSQPYLDLTWETVAGDSQASVTSMSTDPVIQSTSAADRTLTAIVTDPNGGPVSYEVVASASQNGTLGEVVASSGVQTAASGSTVSWTVPESQLQDGQEYTWAVRVKDATHSWNTGPIKRIRTDFNLGANASDAPTDGAGPFSVNLASGNLMTSVGGRAVATAGGPVGFGLTYNSMAPAPSGIVGTYYRDTNGNGSIDPGVDEVLSTQVDSAIEFDVQGEANVPQAATNGGMVRWTGYVMPSETGAITFGVKTTDAVRIKVASVAGASGTLTTVLDRWSEAASTTLWGTSVSLTAGARYKIEVDWRDVTDEAALSLLVKTPSVPAGFRVATAANWLSSDSRFGLPEGWSGIAESGYVEARIGMSSVSLIDSSGGVSTFTARANEPTGWRAPLGSSATLTRGTDGKFTLFDGGTTYKFATSGLIDSVESIADIAKPMSATYVWGGSPVRLLEIRDRLDPSRKITFEYQGQAGVTCSNGGGWAAAPPVGGLCRVRYSATTDVTELLWNSYGQLNQVTNPGYSYTTLSYTNGKLGYYQTDALQRLQGPAGWGAVPGYNSTSAGDFYWGVVYDSFGRVSRIDAPPPPNGGPKPNREFVYANGSTQVKVAGLGLNANVVRTVAYDGEGRTVSETDATNKTTNYTWVAAGQLAKVVDPAGRMSTVQYNSYGFPSSTGVVLRHQPRA
jgi:YD repeat-containing protein